MLILRFLGILAVMALGTCLFAYLFTQDRRYLAFAWRIAKIGLLLALIFFGLLILERVLVPVIPFF